MYNNMTVTLNICMQCTCNNTPILYDLGVLSSPPPSPPSNLPPSAGSMLAHLHTLQSENRSMQSQIMELASQREFYIAINTKLRQTLSEHDDSSRFPNGVQPMTESNLPPAATTTQANSSSLSSSSVHREKAPTTGSVMVGTGERSDSTDSTSAAESRNKSVSSTALPKEDQDSLLQAHFATPVSIQQQQQQPPAPVQHFPATPHVNMQQASMHTGASGVHQSGGGIQQGSSGRSSTPRHHSSSSSHSRQSFPSPRERFPPHHGQTAFAIPAPGMNGSPFMTSIDPSYLVAVSHPPPPSHPPHPPQQPMLNDAGALQLAMQSEGERSLHDITCVTNSVQAPIAVYSSLPNNMHSMPAVRQHEHTSSNSLPHHRGRNFSSNI